MAGLASDECPMASRSSDVSEPDDAPPPLLRIIEALCFVEGRAVTARQATEMISGLTEKQFHQAVTELQRRYREQGRAYSFVRDGEGYLLTLRPQHRFLVERLYGAKKEAVLSLAAIEVLAIVAYRQPVSRSTIEALRGRDSTAAIRQLLRRGLIAVQPRSSIHTDPPAATAANHQAVVSRSSSTAAVGSNSCSTMDNLSVPDAAASASPAPCTAEARSITVTDGVREASVQESQASIASSATASRREQYYVTTPRFLELFGLRDLSDLPRTDDLEIL